MELVLAPPAKLEPNQEQTLLGLSQGAGEASTEVEALWARLSAVRQDVPSVEFRLSQTAVHSAQTFPQMDIARTTQADYPLAHATLQGQLNAWRVARVALAQALVRVGGIRQLRERRVEFAQATREIAQDTEEVRARALEHLPSHQTISDVEAMWQEARALPTRDLTTLPAEALSELEQTLEQERSLWTELHQRYRSLLGTASEVGDIQAMLEGFVGAVSRKSGEYSRYLVSREDVGYFRALLRRAKSIVLKAGSPLIEESGVRVVLNEFSYYDTWQERQISLRGVTLELAKQGESWLIVRVKRPR